MLRSIPNLTLLEIPEGELCCGSAGTYNMEQPEIAGRLGQRKAANILRTGADAVAAGNIGCLVQIATHLKVAGRPLPIYHTMQVLDMAYAAAAHDIHGSHRLRRQDEDHACRRPFVRCAIATTGCGSSARGCR